MKEEIKSMLEKIESLNRRVSILEKFKMEMDIDPFALPSEEAWKRAVRRSDMKKGGEKF